MPQTLYLLWFTLSAVGAQMDDLLYCSFRYERLCQGKGQHVACKYPHKGPGEMCENYTAIIFSNELKQFIIHYINRRRQRIASGHERVRGGMHLPKPQIMMMVQWDRELAALAQRLADQCQFVHDDCRATVRYPYAGQTVGEVRWRGHGESMEMGARRIIRRVFDAWWGERRRVQARQLTSPFVLAARGAVWGHFSQLAVWSLRAVGCGAVHHGYSKPRLLLVCDFSHTNMLGQRTITPGPLASCPLHTARVPQSFYPLLCAPARTEIQKHNVEYKNYRDEEYELDQEPEEIVESRSKARLSKHEHKITSRPVANQDHWAKARPVKSQEPRPKEFELTEPESTEPEPKEPEPKEADEEENVSEEEASKPKPNKSELASKIMQYYEDDRDESSRRYSFESEETTGLIMNIPEETDDTWVPNRPVRPLHYDVVSHAGSYVSLVTRGRGKILGPVTESDRYEDSSNNDNIIRKAFNKALSIKDSAKELENREMRYKAAVKFNARDDWTMKSKGEYKASNGEVWESGSLPVTEEEREQWRQTEDVIPLRPKNVNRQRTTIVVYRPTASISTESFTRHRWKQPRPRPRRPGVNALLKTLIPKLKVKSSINLDKDDENQLFLDTGFKLS